MHSSRAEHSRSIATEIFSNENKGKKKLFISINLMHYWNTMRLQKK